MIILIDDLSGTVIMETYYRPLDTKQELLAAVLARDQELIIHYLIQFEDPNGNDPVSPSRISRLAFQHNLGMVVSCLHSTKLTNWDQAMIGLGLRNSYDIAEDIIKHLAPQGPKNHLWDWIFYGACMGGHLILALGAVENGATSLANGIYVAARHNQVKLLEALKERNIEDPEYLLSGAARGGHSDLVDLALTQNPSQIDQALTHACLGGNKVIVEKLLPLTQSNLIEPLFRACCKNHSEIIELLLEQGISDYNSGMAGAARGGHLNLVIRMIDLGATKYHKAMFHAARNNRTEILNYLKALPRKTRHDDEILQVACSRGHLQSAKIMVACGADDYYEAMLAACRGGQLKMVKYLISLGVEWSHDFYDTCRKYGNKPVADFFRQTFSKVVDDWQEDGHGY